MTAVGIGKASRILVVDVTDGRDLSSSIVEACEQAGIRSGVLASCIGSLKEVTFMNPAPDLTKPSGVGDGEPTRHEGPIQVISGQGFLGVDEKSGGLFLHMHLSVVAGLQHRVVSGHVEPGWAPALNRLEAAILETDGLRIGNAIDKATGGKHLVFSNF